MSDQTPDPHDPLGDRLNRFDPGVPVSPMPAHEVRRRGDRLRTRNRVLTGVAAVAVLAVVATPVALLSGGSEPRTAPAAPDPALSDSMLLEPAQVPPREGIREGLGPWELSTDAADQPASCLPLDGAGLDAASSVSRAFGASLTIGDGDVADPTAPTYGSIARETVLQYDDSAGADAGYDAAVAADAACADAEERSIDPVEPAPYDRDGATGQVAEHLLPGSCTDCDIVLFDRTAVLRLDDDRLLLVSLAEYAGPDVPPAFGRSTKALIKAAVAKAAGDDVPSGETTDPDDTETTTQLIPSGFPLGGGITDDADGQRTGPSDDAPGVSFPDGFCLDWPAGEPVDRLAFRQTGPEYAYEQELLVYGTREEAADALDAVDDALATCAEVPGDSTPNAVEFQTFEDTNTVDSTTFGFSYAEGLGGTVYQAVVVGNALLVAADSGEYSATSLEADVAPITERNAPLIEAMQAAFGG